MVIVKHSHAIKVEVVVDGLVFRTVYYSWHLALLTFVQVWMVQECTYTAIPLGALYFRMGEQRGPLVVQSSTVGSPCRHYRHVRGQRSLLTCVYVVIEFFLWNKSMIEPSFGVRIAKINRSCGGRWKLRWLYFNN